MNVLSMEMKIGHGVQIDDGSQELYILIDIRIVYVLVNGMYRNKYAPLWFMVFAMLT